MLEEEITVKIGGIQLKKVRITVIKKFSPEEIFGHEIIRQSTGKPIPPCYLEEGQEFIVESHLKVPEGFCEKAWLDLYNILMIFYHNGEYDYPEPGMTYTPCADGVRPVIFKIEKFD